MSAQANRISIQVATEEDLPAAEGLLGQGLAEFEDDSDFFRFGTMELLKPLLLAGNTLLARYGDVPVGMVTIITAKDWWYIVGLVVDKEHRGLGVAGELLVAAKSFAAERGAVRGAATAAPRLVEFYSKHGFRPIATVMEYASV